jgi:hypothetical protein
LIGHISRDGTAIRKHANARSMLRVQRRGRPPPRSAPCLPSTRKRGKRVRQKPRSFR